MRRNQGAIIETIVALVFTWKFIIGAAIAVVVLVGGFSFIFKVLGALKDIGGGNIPVWTLFVIAFAVIYALRKKRPQVIRVQ